jgi:tetratricopeptide (TPR) repeat protein
MEDASKKLVFAAAALLATATAHAQPSAAPQPTAQAQFDAASAALVQRNWTEALRLLQALEPRVRDARTLAVVRVREAGALAGLGRTEEAETILRAELPHLPAGDASLNDDRFDGFVTLAQAAERRLDYEDAARAYRLAAAVPIPEIDKLPARRGIIQTLLFSDPEAALREADAALAVVAAGALENHALEGQIQTLKGRALLNLGRFPEARETLTRSMRLLGGLTTLVDRADLVARSDLALAALLAGDTDEARHYLAYTGAGRFSRGYLRPSRTAHLPHCGGELAPGDVAVVEAAVTNDGRVLAATPIYASRRGASALVFARALADWSFEPESVAAIPALFRTVARFEMRCSQAPHEDDAEGGSAVLERVAAKGPAWREALARLRRAPLAQVREHLGEAGAPSRDAAALLPALVTIGLSDAAPSAERQAALRRALTLAAGMTEPAPLLASLALELGYLSMREPNTHRYAARPPNYDALLALPEIAGSPRAALEIRLARARLDFDDGRTDNALAGGMAVSETPGLAAGDPLRIQALELIVAARTA